MSITITFTDDELITIIEHSRTANQYQSSIKGQKPLMGTLIIDLIKGAHQRTNDDSRKRIVKDAGGTA